MKRVTANESVSRNRHAVRRRTRRMSHALTRQHASSEYICSSRSTHNVWGSGKGVKLGDHVAVQLCV